MKHYEYIREKLGDKECQFLLPLTDGKKSYCMDGAFCAYDNHGNPWASDCPNCNGTGYEPILLSDVLMAIYKSKKEVCLWPDGLITDQYGTLPGYCSWNLTLHHLDQQSPETIKAIAELLGYKE